MKLPMSYVPAKTSFLILLFACSSLAAASDSIADLPKKAIERSQITVSGARPFVLKASVLEATNPSNTNYKAEIEEYWIAPNKWRRTVRTAAFSQTLIANGDKTTEQLIGDYYPNWLRTLVTAIFEPGDTLQGVDLSRSSDNPVWGGAQICRRFTFMAGVAPVSNKVFSTFCFEGGLLSSVGAPGYHADYKNYKNFAGKRVAHTIREYIEPGTDVEATITELTELKSVDEAQFVVQETSPPLQTVRTSEEALRGLVVSAPEIVWPTVRSGSVAGTLSLYVCLDRSGHVREIYELNSSNPGLSDVARDQVMKWQFKTATNRGVPVQVESMLTFAFQTSIANPIPILEEEEGLKLLVHRVEPTWPAGFAPVGTPVIVTLGVMESGECYGLVFITSDEPTGRSS
ncbi:MAG TPA: hypothetical protein VIH89_12345 [Candidatus Sulfotelmatobacter sp.]